MSHVTMPAAQVADLARAALARVAKAREADLHDFCESLRKPSWLDRLFRVKPDTRSDEEILRNVRAAGGFHLGLTLVVIEGAYHRTEQVAERLLALASLGDPVVVSGEDAEHIL